MAFLLLVLLVFLILRLRKTGKRRQLAECELDLLQTRIKEEAEREEASQEDAQHIEEVMKRVEEEKLYLHPRLTNREVEQTTGCAARLLGDVFESHTGHKFSEYINELRMKEGARLLVEYPQYTIEAIARMCGIDSRQHFHRLFTNFFDETPSAYRKRMTPTRQ